MDEKLAVSRNVLNQALKNQVAKRIDAPPPSDAAVESHLANLVAPADTTINDFFDAWDTYYPKMVSLLGWASWVFPKPTLTAIKGVLAVINNQIIPIARQWFKD